MTAAYYKGFNTYIIYGVETAYGDGGSPAAGNHVGKVTNFSGSLTNGFIRTQGLGDGRNATSAVLGNFDCSGTIEWDVNDFTFMQYAVGTIGGSGTVAAPYELQENDSLSTVGLEVGSEGGSNDDITTYRGVMINSLSITGTAGEVLKATCEFVAKDVLSSTSLETYTGSTTKCFVFQEGNVTVGTDTLQCTSFTVTLNNNNQVYRNLGDREIQQPAPGIRRYDFTITCRKKYDTTASTLSTTELRELFFSEAGALTPTTAGSVSAVAVSLDITEGSLSGDRVANIDLENCYFESWSEPITLDGGVIEVTVNGFGLAGLTDSTVKVPIRWYTIA